MITISNHLQEQVRQERRWAKTAKQADLEGRETYHIARAEAFQAARRTLDSPLTAAAPDLLEACQAFVEAWEKCLQLEKTATALTMAKIAIEKATK